MCFVLLHSVNLLLESFPSKVEKRKSCSFLRGMDSAICLLETVANGIRTITEQKFKIFVQKLFENQHGSWKHRSVLTAIDEVLRRVGRAKETTTDSRGLFVKILLNVKNAFTSLS